MNTTSSYSVTYPYQQLTADMMLRVMREFRQFTNNGVRYQICLSVHDDEWPYSIGTNIGLLTGREADSVGDTAYHWDDAGKLYFLWVGGGNWEIRKGQLLMDVYSADYRRRTGR